MDNFDKRIWEWRKVDWSWFSKLCKKQCLVHPFLWIGAHYATDDKMINVCPSTVTKTSPQPKIVLINWTRQESSPFCSSLVCFMVDKYKVTVDQRRIYLFYCSIQAWDLCRFHALFSSQVFFLYVSYIMIYCSPGILPLIKSSLLQHDSKWNRSVKLLVQQK